MSPGRTVEDLLAAAEHGGVDRGDLEAAHQLVQSNKLSLEQAAAILLAADSAEMATPAFSHSPTIAELVEAWGPPPRDVLEDWIEQLRQQLASLEQRAAECRRSLPCVAAALTLEAIRVDQQNWLTATELDALHRLLVAVSASTDEGGMLSEPISPAELHPDYRAALQKFAQQIDPSYPEIVPPPATVGESACCGVKPAGTNPRRLAAALGDTSPAGKSRRGREPNADKPRSRRLWSAGAMLAILALGSAFLALHRGEQPDGLEASSSAGAKDRIEPLAGLSDGADEQAKRFDSFESEMAPQAQLPAENDPSDLLDQFARVDGNALSSSEPLLSNADLPGDAEPSTSTRGQPFQADREIGSSELENRSAGEEDPLAEAAALVMPAEPPDREELDLETAIDSALNRPAPIVEDPAIDAVILPPLEDAVSLQLHPAPAEEPSLEFLGPPVGGEPQPSSGSPLRLQAETKTRPDGSAAWEVVEAKQETPTSVVGRIVSDQSGTHFSWAPDVQEHLATALRNGRLQLSFSEASPRSLFLRPPQRTDPVSFDFEQQKLEFAWRLRTPPHPLASRLHIDFQLPEAIAYAWIEPPHLRPPRDLEAIVELRSDETESVALRIRFDVQTGRRLVCRARYAARIDSAFPWQWVTMPAVTHAADQIASEQVSILTNLRQLDAVDGRRGDRSQRSMRRRRREALEQRSEQLITVAERLRQLMQLMHSLQNDGQIGWRLIVEWPDGPQTIFATPFDSD